MACVGLWPARGAPDVRVLRRLRIIVQQRHLLAALVQKDIDARYAGSVLGVVWTQLYPLLLLGVYTFVFSTIFPNSIPRFPFFLFIGIALYTFFSTATLLATNSILANANLVTKLAFPRELVTIAGVLIALIDLAMSHLIFAAGAALFGVPPAWSWLALPALVLLLTGFCIGVGLVLATAAVYLRDVRFFVEVGVLMLMFLSPVFYSDSSVPPSVAWVTAINPLAIVISAYRHALLDGVWPALSTWATLALVNVAALWLGIEVFDRGQRGFPDAL
jgi:ABC-type polysaccharide/polyol phosphate export permease